MGTSKYAPIVSGQRSAVSAEASRVLAALREAGATAPANAITDVEIALAADVSSRDVVDLAEELTQLDIAVLASCKAPAGRYLETNPDAIQQYAEDLNRRAVAIHARAKSFRGVAARLRERQSVQGNGQMRLPMNAAAMNADDWAKL